MGDVAEDSGVEVRRQQRYLRRIRRDPEMENREASRVELERIFRELKAIKTRVVEREVQEFRK